MLGNIPNLFSNGKYNVVHLRCIRELMLKVLLLELEQITRIRQQHVPQQQQHVLQHHVLQQDHVLQQQHVPQQQHVTQQQHRHTHDPLRP